MLGFQLQFLNIRKYTFKSDLEKKKINDWWNFPLDRSVLVK